MAMYQPAHTLARGNAGGEVREEGPPRIQSAENQTAIQTGLPEPPATAPPLAAILRALRKLGRGEEHLEPSPREGFQVEVEEVEEAEEGGAPPEPLVLDEVAPGVAAADTARVHPGEGGPSKEEGQWKGGLGG